MREVTGGTQEQGNIHEGSFKLPRAALPHIPEAGVLWSRALILAWVLLACFLLDQLTLLLADFWLLQELGFESVFWTNFRTGAALFALAFVAFAGATAAPAFVHRLGTRARRLAVLSGLFVGLVAGYFLSIQFQVFLLFGGESFGKTDPVFGRDIGFYVFNLPSLWVMWTVAFLCALLALVSSVGCAYLANRERRVRSDVSRLAVVLGLPSTLYTLAMLGILGVLAAAGVWLSRFDLLIKNNEEVSPIVRGAEYVDVTGLFSTRNDYLVTALVVLGATAAVVFMLRTLHQAVTSSDGPESRRPLWSGGFRIAGFCLLALVVVDFGFKAMISVRDQLMVKPNEPVIQLEYIQRHIDGTRAGYGLENIETEEFVPKGPDDPVPDAEKFLDSPTLENAPLWPGFTNYFEPLLDPAYVERVRLAGGDEDPTKIYGPTQEIFQQQQKLRAYYDFMDVDTARYNVDGQPKMFASAVREIPLLEPQPWLLWWGQQHILFTHGHGLVMAPTGEKILEGEPTYASGGIPSQAESPELQVEKQQVYYGEGAGLMAFSNVQQVGELDYPTDEGRATNTLEPGDATSVPIDSLLKRAVLGWRSGQFSQVVFSDIIGPETSVHYYRTPLERIERLAPFLYLDSDPFAVAADGRIVWMVNGMTTSDRYPYSRLDYLGDKAVSRVDPELQRPTRWSNYVRDSVKGTVDASTGEVKLYKISDEPVIESWASIYPDLFEEEEAMPQSIREQLQYPTQLFHTQFDDIYWMYHMTDPMTFFNAEDMWDDADEVKGPVTTEGEAITFSSEPSNWIAETGDVLPASENGTQFTLSMPFTNEQAVNLRAITNVYQDGSDYGRLSVLQVPKGEFYPGPEQADAAIDEDPFISQQFALTNRLGNEVIRGHTSTLVLGDEVIYVEPLFFSSEQNPVPLMKQVIVVYRGQPAIGDTLQDALEVAMETVRSGSESDPLAPPPPPTAP